jgi:hypothetical protein
MCILGYRFSCLLTDQIPYFETTGKAAIQQFRNVAPKASFKVLILDPSYHTVLIFAGVMAPPLKTSV